MRKKSIFNLNAYRVKVSNEEFKYHILNDGLYESKINEASFLKANKIEKGILAIKIVKKKTNLYYAFFIATYLANKLLLTGQSFCYETVMSHI